MKRLIGIAAGIVFAVNSFAAGGSPIAAETCTFTNLRTEATAMIPGVYTRGDTLSLTNCAVYKGSTTNAGVQTLTNVTVTLAVGDQASSTIYTGVVVTASAGTWACNVTVPTNGNMFVETRLKDENNSTYTYSGWKILSVQDALH